jgi:hypothetical protein
MEIFYSLPKAILLMTPKEFMSSSDTRMSCLSQRIKYIYKKKEETGEKTSSWLFLRLNKKMMNFIPYCLRFP